MYVYEEVTIGAAMMLHIECLVLKVVLMSNVHGLYIIAHLVLHSQIVCLLCKHACEQFYCCSV